MIGALFNALFGWRIGKGNIAFVACASVGASFLLAVMCFGCVFPDVPEGAAHPVLFQNVFTWFAVPAGLPARASTSTSPTRSTASPASCC